MSEITSARTQNSVHPFQTSAGALKRNDAQKEIIVRCRKAEVYCQNGRCIRLGKDRNALRFLELMSSHPSGLPLREACKMVFKGEAFNEQTVNKTYSTIYGLNKLLGLRAIHCDCYTLTVNPDIRFVRMR